MKCKYGHNFGKDHDCHNECDDCEEEIYSSCSEEYCRIKFPDVNVSRED